MKPAPGLPLRLLDAALGVLLFLVVLYAGIMATVVLVGSDSGAITLRGTVHGRYDVTVRDRTFEAGPRGNGWVDGPATPIDQPLVLPHRALDVEVALPLHQGEHRYVLAWGFLVSLAFVLTALLSLRRLVGDARSGEPFTGANVRRLRVAAGSVLLWPIASRLLSAALNAVVDTDPAATVRWPGPGTWTCVLVGLALLALGEVFRRGVTLRELEEATV